MRNILILHLEISRLSFILPFIRSRIVHDSIIVNFAYFSQGISPCMNALKTHVHFAQFSYRIFYTLAYCTKVAQKPRKSPERAVFGGFLQISLPKEIFPTLLTKTVSCVIINFKNICSVFGFLRRNKDAP